MAHGFLLGSSYGISTGLLVYGFETDIVPYDTRLLLLLGWAFAGLVLALLALRRPKPAGQPQAAQRSGSQPRQAVGAEGA